MVSLESGLRLDGKVALVTGGSLGIGKASAALLAAAGASVCIVARDKERVDAAVEEITADGGNVIGIAGSALDPGIRDLSIERCLELGGLDILVNNAGGSRSKTPIMELSDEELRWTVDLNLEVPLRYTRLAWEAWMAEHGGSVVNVTSLAGIRPSSGYGWYGATKAGLAHLTKLLALELAPKVRVNCVAPGAIATEMFMTNTTPEHQQLRAQRPLGRLGDPMHIAYAVLFFASPASAFTTGQQLAVDGGGLLG